jgi:Mn-containing catalase
MPKFTDKYYDMSQGNGEGSGPWNRGNGWEVVSDREQQAAVDGGDGTASVGLSADEEELLVKAASRTASRTDVDPTTGADLGAGKGAGTTKPTGGAKRKP